MAAVQSADALIAAFGFGIVVITSIGSAVIYLAGHGLSCFRICQRPVLIAFFTASALWAFTAFIAATVNEGNNNGCQIALVFSSLFDQIARVMLAQFLLWIILDGPKSSKIGIALQSGILVRLVLGCAYMGFQSPQFDPVCVERNERVPLGVALIVVDACFLLFLFGTAYATGILDLEGQRGARNLAVPIITMGAGLWTATSTPMILGLAALGLLSRTLAPAIGLLSVLVTIILMKGDLSALRERGILGTEATTPVMTWRNNPFTRDIVGASTSESSSDSASDDHIHRDDRRGWSAYYPPGTTMQSQLARPTIRLVPESIRRTSVLTRFLPQHNMDNGVAIRDVQKYASRKVKKGVRNGTLVISDPKVVGNNQAPGMETVDLETAARIDWEKRNRTISVLTMEAFYPIPERRSSLMHPSSSPNQTQRPLSRVPRKAVGSLPRTRSQLEPVDELTPMGISSSALVSPGLEEVRRRSPRFPPLQTQNLGIAMNGPLSTVREALETPYSLTHRSLPLMGIAELPGDYPSSKHHTLQADTPLSRDSDGENRNNAFLQLSQDLIDRIESVVNRPRPVPRSDAGNGKIFLRGDLQRQKHRRSLSVGSIKSKKSILLSTPGSPSTLPPLPPVPRSAGLPAGRRRDNTKGMTVEEKVSIFMSLNPERSRGAPLLKDEGETSLFGAPKMDTRDATIRVLSQQSDESMRSSFLTADVLHLSTGSPAIRTSKLAMNTTTELGKHVEEHHSINALLDHARRTGNPDTKSASTPNHVAHASQDSTSSTSSSSSTWHRRIGEELPAFSDRKSACLSRRLPPPPLNIPGGKNAVVSPEPSPASSRPSLSVSDDALEMIDEQLRCLGDAASGSTITSRENKQTLLGTLEDEIDKHETRWRKLRMAYVRDSQSSIKTSPSRTQKEESPELRHFPPVPSHKHASMNGSVGSIWQGQDKRVSSQGHSPDPRSRRWSSVSRQAGNRHSVTSASQQMNVPTPPDTDEDGSGKEESSSQGIQTDQQADVYRTQLSLEEITAQRALNSDAGSELVYYPKFKGSKSGAETVATENCEKGSGGQARNEGPRLSTGLGLSHLAQHQPNRTHNDLGGLISKDGIERQRDSIEQNQDRNRRQALAILDNHMPSDVSTASPAPNLRQARAPAPRNQASEPLTAATSLTYQNLKSQQSSAYRRLSNRLVQGRPMSTYDSIPMLLDVASLSSPASSKGPSSAPLLLEQQQHTPNPPTDVGKREIPQQGRGRVQRQANVWDCYAAGGGAAAAGRHQQQGSRPAQSQLQLSMSEIRLERRRRRAFRTTPTCVSRFSVQRRPSTRKREKNEEDENR